MYFEAIFTAVPPQREANFASVVFCNVKQSAQTMALDYLAQNLYSLIMNTELNDVRKIISLRKNECLFSTGSQWYVRFLC